MRLWNGIFCLLKIIQPNTTLKLEHIVRKDSIYIIYSLYDIISP